ncbi:MAG: hypothetical protein R2940_05550 [Syntrophotaleaceae bacterium]
MKKLFLFLVCPLLAGILMPSPCTARDGEAALRRSYQAFLARPSSAMPIQVVSQTGDEIEEAEIYAVLKRDFASLAEILSSPGNWCEIFPVILNIKACTWKAREGKGRPQLTFYVGRKYYEAPGEAYELKYDFLLRENRKDFFHVALVAPEGPFGTSDYRLEVKAIPVAQGSFLSVRTSHRSSFASRMATRSYLATLGRDKIGFTRVGGDKDNPEYIKGVRGMVERNAVRYYLALQAYLETRHMPPAKRYSAATELWYDLTEQYHDQLFELEKSRYLDIKRRERQQQERLQEKNEQKVGKKTAILHFSMAGDKMFIEYSKNFENSIRLKQNGGNSWKSCWSSSSFSSS